MHPCQQLWSKAEAGGLDKSVDLLVPRFRLHQVLASHGKAQVKSPPPNNYPHRSPGPKVKEGDVLMLRCPGCCEHARLWEVGKNGEVRCQRSKGRADRPRARGQPCSETGCLVAEDPIFSFGVMILWFIYLLSVCLIYLKSKKKCWSSDVVSKFEMHKASCLH